MPQPPDANVRLQALDPTESFAVSAPAGSGKTSLLTQRLLALLARCEQPENVLAITFTRKAAAEMQQRILSALRAARETTSPPKEAHLEQTWKLAVAVNKRDAELGWQIHSLPHRLRVTTIDGFCHHLSQYLPLSNQPGATPEVMDEPELNLACQQAIRETFALLEQAEPLQQDLIRLIRHFNNQPGNLEALFVRLLKCRDQWLGPLLSSKDQRQFLETTLKQVISEHLQTLRKQLLPFAGELIGLAEYAGTNLKQSASDSRITATTGWLHLPEADNDHLQLWLALAELCLTKAGQFRKKVDTSIGFPAPAGIKDREEKALVKHQKQAMQTLLTAMAATPELENLLRDVRHLPGANYTDRQWQLLDSLTRVLTQLTAQLQLVFQQQGKTDYIEITLAALRALGDEEQPSDVALTLDYRIQHILVDEFQDTSVSHRQLLQQLTIGWQPGDGRTLFLVGDAMQSCYSFREANVGIFLDCRQHGLGDLPLQPLDLTENFRSQSTLVSWFNQTFEAIMPAADNINRGAVACRPATAFHPAGDSGGVSTHLLVSSTRPLHRQREAQQIVELIRRAHQQRPGESIAILVRKRQQVGIITKTLKQAEIPCKATDIDRLDEQMVIQDLLSLTRAMLYLNDRISWLAVLRAPWCGLDLHDLHKVATFRTADTKTETESAARLLAERPSLVTVIVHHRKDLALSPEGTVLLDRFAVTVELLLAQQGRRPLRQWIEGGWLQLGGSALLVDLEEESMVESYFRCLEQHSQGWRIRNWDGFEQAINLLFAENHTGHKNADHRDESPVEIMTIHKSKGLEFDTVIIPGLDLTPASDPQELLVWQQWLPQTGSHQSRRQSRLIISPVHGSGNERDPIHDFIRRQKSRRQQLESDRLLYVGCTRAIHQLHLLAWVTRQADTSGKEMAADKKDEAPKSEAMLAPPPKKSMLASLWPLIARSAIRVDVDKDESSLAEVNRHPNLIIRQSPAWQRPDYPRCDLLADWRRTHFSETIAIDNRLRPDEYRQRQSRYFGSTLHLALRQVTETGCQHWDHQRLQRQQTLWTRNLQQLGVAPDEAEKKSTSITGIIASMLADSTGRWLLDNQHSQSACELSLWTQRDNKIREYIIDRTFIDKATQTRWIIDYKSSEPEGGQGLEEFFIEQETRHGSQLANYYRLFQQLDDDNRVTITTALYFPSLLALRVMDNG